MKLGVMQPYFFPYLGYFDLIGWADEWVVFDTAQYIRHGWVNRNRILHPTEGWQYVTAPLKKHHRETAICDIAVNNDVAWKKKIIGQVQHYKRKAPFFEQVEAMLSRVLAYRGESLTELNILALQAVCELLGIDFTFSRSSHFVDELPPNCGPGDWALEICRRCGATEYLNPPGGEGLFDRDAFRQAGIDLCIQDFASITYAPRGYSFEPNLSVLDVMMWVPAREVVAYLRDVGSQRIQAGT